MNAIILIKNLLGGLETKTAVNCLLDNDRKGCFEILLKYYDKHYTKALQNRPQLNDVICQVPAEDVHAKNNAQKILNKVHEGTTIR